MRRASSPCLGAPFISPTYLMHTTNLLGAAVSYSSVHPVTCSAHKQEEQALFTSANVHTSLEVVVSNNSMVDTHHGPKKQQR